jgi:hypothetical protein
MSGIYHNPEKYGLTTIGEIDWSDGEYQFDFTVVWQDGDESFWYGDDSGCSCPSPFEDTGLNDLVRLPSLEQFKTHCESRMQVREDRSMEMVSLIEKLHGLGLR